MKNLSYFLFAGLLFYACQSEPLQDWEKKELLACCQLPISVLAPDSAVIKSSNLGLFKDITIQAGDDYNVQIYASEATTNDIAKIKSEQLKQVKELHYFSRLIEEDENGFLFENVIDSTNVNYSFRYVAVSGDMEYVFQPGLIGLFTEDEARRMYEAVKQ
ncbi:MAG: hypothetical protein R2824_11365 [Saprospiraceae bacterium]|nr:hypothetical protein [Lewinella sp.]